jgi:hypothetical protein
LLTEKRRSLLKLSRRRHAVKAITNSGLRVLLFAFVVCAIHTPLVFAQTTSAQLSITLTVQSSISLVFNNNPSVGTNGFCPLTNAGTNNVGLDLGAASFPNGADSLACVSYTHVGGAAYQVSSAFDVVVTKTNSSSPNYRLAAQISTAPPQDVTWLVDNIALNSTGFTTLNTANNYGQALTKTLQVKVKNTVPAQTLQETITFLATGN